MIRISLKVVSNTLPLPRNWTVGLTWKIYFILCIGGVRLNRDVSDNELFSKLLDVVHRFEIYHEFQKLQKKRLVIETLVELLYVFTTIKPFSDGFRFYVDFIKKKSRRWCKTNVFN